MNGPTTVDESTAEHQIPVVPGRAAAGNDPARTIRAPQPVQPPPIRMFPATPPEPMPQVRQPDRPARAAEAFFPDAAQKTQTPQPATAPETSPPAPARAHQQKQEPGPENEPARHVGRATVADHAPPRA
jgi:hypothetical protein